MTKLQETRIETYIPLYRKYRPQSFSDVVGQEAVLQTLGNAISLHKVAHAYLFCGPRGTGKTSMARIFAKSLNCEQGPTVTPCLQCASCTGIAHGNALDVVEFDAASNNGVENARELIENCQYSSLSGRFKVYIIDEVHMLSTSAFNALLKTLEEPPPNVIFIFATTEAHKVLPTIISRCQRFDFTRITTDNITGRLRAIAEAEGISIEDEALQMIARHVRGGMRDAIGLLDQVGVLGRANPGQSISRKDVALFIGTMEEDLLLRLSAAIAERRAADLLNDVTELMSRGIEPIQLLKEMTIHFRNLLLVQAVGSQASPDALSLPADYLASLVQQVSLFPEPEELPQIIGRLSAVERNIRNGTQPQLWLEVGLMELAYRHEIYQVKALSERVARLEAQLTGGAAPMAVASTGSQSRDTAATPKPSVRSQPAKPVVQSTTFANNPVGVSSPAVAPAPVRPMAPQEQATSMLQAPDPMAMASLSTVGSVLSNGVQGITPSGTGQANVDLSLETDYRQICAGVPSLTLRSLLQQQAFPLGMDQDVLTVGVVSEPNLMVLKKPDRFIHLQKAADKYFGRSIRIELVHKKNRPAASTAPTASTSRTASPLPTVASPSAMREMAADSSSSAVGPLFETPASAEVSDKREPAGAISGSMPSTAAVMDKLAIQNESPVAPLNSPVSPPDPPVTAPTNAETPSSGISRRPAMAILPEAPPLLNLKKMPPVMNSSNGFDPDAPPIDMDDTPPADLDEGMDEAFLPVSKPVDFEISSEATNDPELHEAKKHAIQVLQGRVLD